MEQFNPSDKVTLDIPLFIRLLEYAREDAKTDMDLHNVAEKAIAASETGKTLTMAEYDSLVAGSSEDQEINEIKRMQQLAGLLKENQASEQGYWDTENTLNHIKDELKLNNIKFNIRPNIPEENIAMVDINSSNKFSDIINLAIRDGIVYINDKEFNLNEDNTLADIINYIKELVK
jgi:hypothetical protein